MSEILCKRKRPFVSYNNRNLSDDASISTTSMNPAGKHGSVRILPSTLTCFDMQICFASMPVMAYFRRFLRMRMRGRHSRNLCGPVDGRGAKAPSILPSIQCFGAFTRLRWCFGPRAMVAVLARCCCL